MREYPSGDGIRLISVNAGGSIPPSRMSPGRSRIAGSTSGYCPIHDVKEKTLKPSILKSGTWSHRMSEWAILINPAQPLQTENGRWMVAEVYARASELSS